MKRPVLSDSFILSILILDYGGIGCKKEGVAKFRYYLSSIIVILLSTIELLCLIAQVQYDWPDILKIISTTYFFLCEFGYFGKLCYFTYKRKTYFKILKLIDHPIMNQYTERHYGKINKMIDLCNFIAKVFRYSCVCFVIVYVIVPQINYNPDKSIPTAGYFYLDPKKYRFLIAIFQFFLISGTCAFDTSLDLILLALMSISTTQFEILEDNIKNFSNDGIEEEEALNNINKCVVHHNFLISFIAHIQDLYSLGIFLKIMASVLIICLSGFYVMLVPLISVQFFITINFMNCMFIQIGIYCWFGHELFTKSDAVMQACYMSNWYKYSSRVQKMFFIMMERSKRQVQFTAAKFFVLNLPTFAMILRNSYTYFSVLQVYKDKFSLQN